MRTPTSSKARRTTLALTAATGLAIAGLGVGSQAAFAGTATAQQAHHKVTFTRSCAVPQHAGYLACNALRVTGGSTVKTHLVHPAAATGARQANAQADATVSGYGPADIQSAYNLASAAAANGAGETVAIVDAQDDPNAESDLATYRSQFGLPACTSAGGCFSKVDENGGTNYPSPDSGWAGEISLDLDMVSATCPNCNILLVEASSASTQDLGTAVNQAVALGAKFVSNSYGGSESSDEVNADSSYYNHPGVAITASAGDSGYGVEYPAASPYVTAVGGTSLTQDSSARGWSESVWGTSATEGTGSGCSAYETKPTWQTDSGCANRTVADVSAVADPATGVAVYDTYGASGWNVYGGTSASSPIIASVYALAGNPGANTTPAADLYAADPSNLNNVTTGSNGDCGGTYLCTAGPGYNGPTGLGTPNGTGAFSG
ncbi:S53 family peptidase [Kitasatospora sp. NBC_01266]|uniref:S53 family peptidase n=1 Tax=Kitasatospora sp. NBC_01266 TaxID=2903572 RepID=UPI002E314823|nr:S53 family peptidase [Kitasatospora sp. NBC_01266]